MGITLNTAYHNGNNHLLIDSAPYSAHHNFLTSTGASRSGVNKLSLQTRSLFLAKGI